MLRITKSAAYRSLKIHYQQGVAQKKMEKKNWGMVLRANEKPPVPQNCRKGIFCQIHRTQFMSLKIYFDFITSNQ